jgi:hypothetical protein
MIYILYLLEDRIKNIFHYYTTKKQVEQYFNFMRLRDQHPDFKEKLPQRKPSESCYYSSELWVKALGGSHFCCIDFIDVQVTI